MLCTRRTLLFASCIFFLLTLGVDALQCHSCATIDPSKPCDPSLTCEDTSEEATCISIKYYQGENLLLTTQDCRSAKDLCGTTEYQPKTDYRAEISCCNEDLCN